MRNDYPEFPRVASTQLSVVAFEGLAEEICDGLAEVAVWGHEFEAVFGIVSVDCSRLQRRRLAARYGELHGDDLANGQFVLNRCAEAVLVVVGAESCYSLASKLNDDEPVSLVPWRATIFKKMKALGEPVGHGWRSRQPGGLP